MIFKKLFTVIGALAAVGAASLPLHARETVPLDAFAMMPTVLDAEVSPNGKRIGIVRSTTKAGHYLLEIRRTDDLGGKPVRIGSEVMELRRFTWLNNDRLLVNFRQNVDTPNSNEWNELNAVINADASGKWLQLPENAEVLNLWRKNPNEIIISHDANDNRIPDVMKFNIRTGRTGLIMRGSDNRGGYIVDVDGEVRGAVGFDAGSGSLMQYARLKGDSRWRLIKKIDPNARENFELLGFSTENPNQIYVNANNGNNTSGIYLMDIETGQLGDRLFGLKSVDAGGLITSVKMENFGAVTGFTYDTGSFKRYFIDEGEKAIYDGVQAIFPEKTIQLLSRSVDDNAIVIRTTSDRDPGSYYLLLDKSRIEFLASELPLLEEKHLSTQRYVKYQARDGRSIPAYVTIPNGEAPFPAIVMPHGGPWARDYGGFDEWAQLLAHHGYVVIQPQFRGSEGYGLDHWMAGDAKWGLEMQDDNDDAALYLVDKGLATRDKLAIFGWSYGGYAAFVGSMRENNIYQCAIPGAGVSDMSLIRGGIHGSPFLRKFQRPTIKGVSPIDHVEKVNVPMLVIHGDIDQRVDVVHSRKFVSRLKDHDKDYRYLELEGADHFSNTLYYDHKTEFYGALLEFLASEKCFGK